MGDIFRQLNDHLSGKELFIRFTAHAFRKLLSIYVFSYFPFGFEGRIWDLIVSVRDHCLFFLLRIIIIIVKYAKFTKSFTLIRLLLLQAQSDLSLHSLPRQLCQKP